MKIVLSNGGGTNSTAILVGMHERGEHIDIQLFADTGSEKPHTYEHIKIVSAWCESVGFPPVTVVVPQLPQQRKDGSLENECLRLGTLPSKTYGGSGCSLKWKIEPINRWLRDNGFVDDLVRVIGYDADEGWRADRANAACAERGEIPNRFPLVEWGWGRDECIAAIKRAGLPQPGKSACFFCPSSKKWEIVELSERYPDLMARALEMERRALAGEGRAPATTCDGLGRHFAWADVLKAKRDQCVIDFSDAGAPEVCSSCYDGD